MYSCRLKSWRLKDRIVEPWSDHMLAEIIDQKKRKNSRAMVSSFLVSINNGD